MFSKENILGNVEAIRDARFIFIFFFFSPIGDDIFDRIDFHREIISTLRNLLVVFLHISKFKLTETV